MTSKTIIMKINKYIIKRSNMGKEKGRKKEREENNLIYNNKMNIKMQITKNKEAKRMQKVDILAVYSDFNHILFYIQMKLLKLFESLFNH